MKFNKLAVGLAFLSVVTWANAAGVPEVPLPVEDGGLLALTAVCLAIGLRIARRKRDR